MAFTTLLRSALLCAFVCATYIPFNSCVKFRYSESCPQNYTTSSKLCAVCQDKPKNVTLHVFNVLKNPQLDMSLTVTNTHQEYLLGIMQEAANCNTSFRFSATYFNLQLGFYLDAYDFVYANYTLDSSFWQILDGNKKPTKYGISNYIPVNGETVMFNLTIASN